MKEMIKRKFPLKMDLQTFADDPDPNPNPNPNPDPDPNKGKTFTQAELDAAVQSRLSRAEKTAKTALAKELGYDSIESMQDALKKPEDKKDDKTDPVDVDKRVKELLEAGQKEQNEKTFKRLLSAEVKVLANEIGFVDWEEAMTFADLSEAKEDEKGNIIAKQGEDGKVTSVKEALEALAAKKPHLLKQKASTGAFGSTLPNNSSGKPPVGYDAGKSIAELRNQKGSDKK